MEDFGSYLRTQREKKGIRLEEIASITKIHLHSLELLEGNHWEHLPPEPFIRGFIVAYAKYVGLDIREVLERYYQTKGITQFESEPKEALHSAEPRPSASESASEVLRNPKELPIGKIAGAFGVIALIGITTGLIYIGKRSSESDRAPSSPTSPVVENIQPTTTTPESSPVPPVGDSPTGVPPVSTLTPPASTSTDLLSAVSKNISPVGQSATPLVNSPTQVPVADPAKAAEAKTEETKKDNSASSLANSPTTSVSPTTPPVAASDKKHEVVVEGKERTWIKVVVDNEAPIEYFLPEGERAVYSAKDKIKVVLGNSTGAKVSHNGEMVSGSKFMGTIRSYKFPSNARFPQDAASKRFPSSKVLDNDESTPTPNAPADEALSLPQ